MKTAFMVSSALLLCGCTVGPNFGRPQAPMPPQWNTNQIRGVSAGVEPQTDLWWKSFRDPELDSLVRRTVEANYDLKIATTRVDEARAAHGFARSDFLPQVTAGVTADRNRQFFVAPLPGLRASSFEISNYRGSFDASWELDLFGRIRREVQAANADLAASEEDRRNVLVALLGDIGRHYADLRGFQLRLSIAEQNIAVAQDALNLTRAQSQAGQATEREVAQAETQLEAVQAQVPAIESSILLPIHRLGRKRSWRPRQLAWEWRRPTISRTSRFWERLAARPRNSTI